MPDPLTDTASNGDDRTSGRLAPSATGEASPVWNRRSLLIGALAAGVLAACSGGNDDSSDTAGGTAGDTAADPPDGSEGAPSGTDPADDIDSSTLAFGTYTVVQRFPQHVQAPGSQRLPMSLSTGAAELIQDGPATLGAVVVDAVGTEISPRLTAKRRDVEPAPYYDFHTAVPEEGFYSLVVDGGPEDGAGFQVTAPGDVTVPAPGAPLPPFDTPTIDDSRGVDPICTRDPEPCPFHDVTLTEALENASADGRVVAYYIGTPALCQTGSCTPALESMIDLRDEFADTVTFVHAEVYIDDAATAVTPAVEAAGLDYEPVLFITDSDGIIVERLDAVWNVTELRETLLRAVG
ncbi:MAG: hypothetical protein QNM02_17385 [Acidimicrobiia bacterium]|nr:hypothetical protein [Acidimicrobiia bacterium]